jgi:dihydroflavonol-4-reductase
MSNEHTVLVLGAAGTVGSRVALALCNAGYRVRCLGRSKGARNLAVVKAAGAELLWGDMNDEAELADALKGCSRFVHCAAPYPRSGLRFGLKRMLREWPPQVAGHFALAHKAGVERAVFTSSLSTIGLAPDGEQATEALPWDAKRQGRGTYHPVKAALEAAIMEHAAARNVVIVNPTALVGEGSRNPDQSAVCVFFQGRAPLMMDAPMNFVDCDDQARGHVLALEKGVPGERYILGGVDMRLRRFAEVVGALSQRRRPPCVPRVIVRAGAYAAEFAGLFKGGPGAVNLVSYNHLRLGQNYSSARAHAELPAHHGHYTRHRARAGVARDGAGSGSHGWLNLFSGVEGHAFE